MGALQVFILQRSLSDASRGRAAAACDLADAYEIKDMGKGSHAPSPSFYPASDPATGSSTAPAGKPGRLCRSGFFGAL